MRAGLGGCRGAACPSQKRACLSGCRGAACASGTIGNRARKKEKEKVVTISHMHVGTDAHVSGWVSEEVSE